MKQAEHSDCSVRHLLQLAMVFEKTEDLAECSLGGSAVCIAHLEGYPAVNRDLDTLFP